MSDFKDDVLLQIVEKVDNMNDKLHVIERNQQRHDINLGEHMRRTELSEIKLNMFEADIVPVLKSVKWLKTTSIAVTAVLTIVAIAIKIRFG